MQCLDFGVTKLLWELIKGGLVNGERKLMTRGTVKLPSTLLLSSSVGPWVYWWGKLRPTSTDSFWFILGSLSLKGSSIPPRKSTLHSSLWLIVCWISMSLLIIFSLPIPWFNISWLHFPFTIPIILLNLTSMQFYTWRLVVSYLGIFLSSPLIDTRTK